MAEEKIFTIPLREAYKKTERRRVPYAARLVREYLRVHMKTDEVKLGKHLNEELWKRSIKRPPRKIRVRAFVSDGAVKAELMGFDYVDFKARPKAEKKDVKEKLMERLGPKAIKKEEEEKKAGGTAEKPKEAAPVEKHDIHEEEK